MTEVLEAVEDVKRQPERILTLAAAFYHATRAGVKQKALVEETGYTREHIRRLVEDERIRRGEIDPTPRYLREQARRQRVES